MKYSIKENRSGKYQVIKEGSSRATRVFDDYKEAKDYIEQREKKEKMKNKKNITFGKVIIVIILGFIIGFACGYFIPLNLEENNLPDEGVITEEELSIHFLELGNKYTGDCVYIKAGNNDILIDAGSRNSSSETISNYINNYITDGIIEYVIATHAHQDHIAGFVGTKAAPGIFERYECEIIIDFPLTNSTSAVYNNYISLRDKEIKEGAKHYTALDCYNNVNGGQRSYDLGEGLKLEILYNYFYDHKTSDENDYSVCVLLNDGLNNYLFTGDLEKDGEEYLVEYNNLPKCKVYKAGHHGSKTSSSEVLLEVIQPEIVCVCCCAGSTEYTSDNDNTFPTQDFINRVSKYTDQIFVTTLDSDNKEGFVSMNGNIVVSLNNGLVTINCSNNNVILKDTEWFDKNRKWPNK